MHVLHDNDMAHAHTLSEIHTHHKHLLFEIQHSYQNLLARAQQDSDVIDMKDQFADLLTAELIPHAISEEETIYQDGLQQSDLRMLVEAMIDEHRRIVRTIEDLKVSTEPMDIVAKASGFITLLEAHFDKENQLLLPALNKRGLLAS